ncbi:hypothetical protein NP511_12600 [Natrinema thermotolerans]|uniref:Uncharacterized protein n=1 Tax=Natrinema thermotolerans TaxID=121872 RepID=A0AAF0P966_9EURY|nr:hypothetical protein [Natrinema thermotolerans]QCC59259.1 hypothetical protein DVR14_11740 [Natrinema thermotolerans]WMT06224.1 hypothetical protein NP511_12600 [Natrinema thermotolerans]
MTAPHDDATTDESIDDRPGIEDLTDREELVDPESGLTAASDALGGGTLSVLGGGLLLAAAVRSLAANRRRAIPLAVAGGALAGYGLRRRRSSAESGGVPDIEGGTDGKDVSDAASAAAERVDSSRESEIEGDGEITADRGIDDPADSGSRIEFTDEPDEDPSQSRPDLGADEGEPRRETGTDEVEVDVSDTAMADETSEATGPDPTQAQPTQTAETEPEASPAEDASEMKVEPPDDDESESETDDEAATDNAEATDDEADEDEK